MDLDLQDIVVADILMSRPSSNEKASVPKKDEAQLPPLSKESIVLIVGAVVVLATTIFYHFESIESFIYDIGH